MTETIKTYRFPRPVIGALLLLLASPVLASDFSSTWLGGDGNWGDGTQWDTSPVFPNNGGGLTYDATINAGNVTLDQPITIETLFLNGGGVEGNSDLTLNAGLSWMGGTISGPVNSAINLETNSNSTFSAASALGLSGRTINNSGVVNQNQIISSIDGSITNAMGGTWNAQPGASLDDQFMGQFVFNNVGDYVVTGGGSNFTTTGTGAIFNNSGSVTIHSNNAGFTNDLFVSGGGTGGGSFNVEAQGILIFSAEPPLGGVPLSPNYTLTAGAMITGAGMTDNQGIMTVAGNTTIGTDFRNEGSLTIQSGATLTFNGSFSQFDMSSYDVHLSGGAITAANGLVFAGGKLSGSGTVNGNVTTDGTVSPGNSAGTLTINGDLALGFRAALAMQIGGLIQGTEYDHIAVSGNFSIGVTDNVLLLSMLNGFESQLDGSQTFTLLTSNSAITGVFTNVANGDRLETLGGLASFQVNYGTGSPFGANDLVLSNAIAVPEPVSAHLIAAGLLLIGLRSVARRKP